MDQETTLRHVGETATIRRLLEAAGAGETPGVFLGPGDDAAFVRCTGGLLVSVDTLVEGTHFDLAFMTPRDVGARALACALSDLAAMGGSPAWYAVAVTARPSLPLRVLVDLYQGLGEVGREYHVPLVGGDLVGADGPLAVSLTVGGEPDPAGVVTRAGARPGDVLAVTGPLGYAAWGLGLARRGNPPKTPEEQRALSSFLRPRPRLVQGRVLARVGAHALDDVTDGLAAELWAVAEASRTVVAVELSRIPVPQELDRGEALRLALVGGEDLELLVALPPESLVRANRWLVQEGCPPLVEIGRVEDVAEEGRVLVREGGEERLLSLRGYDAFRGADT